MGYYRPRPSELKACAHCGLQFETNHKRAIYCGTPCRVLAYKARHGCESQKTGSAKGDLNFSLRNVGMVATGAGTAAVLNHLLHDEPAHKQLLAELATIKREQSRLVAQVEQLTKGQQQTKTYINAQVSQSPELRASIVLEQAKQNLQLAQERRDLGKIEEFTKLVQMAQNALMAGR